MSIILVTTLYQVFSNVYFFKYKLKHFPTTLRIAKIKKIQRPQEKGDVIILMVKLKAKNMIQKPATCFFN